MARFTSQYMGNAEQIAEESDKAPAIAEAAEEIQQKGVDLDDSRKQRSLESLGLLRTGPGGSGGTGGSTGGGGGTHVETADSRSPPGMTVEALPVKGAFVYRGVLSPEECESLVTTLDAESEWRAAHTNKRYRDCERTTLFSDELAEFVHSRLNFEATLPEELRNVTVTREKTVASGAIDELGTEGRWRPHGLNNYWRTCRYREGGLFAPHHDGLLVMNPGGGAAERRSFLTVMLYLTGGFEGGETVFLPEELKVNEPWTKDDVIAQVRPEPGMCLVFWQATLHAGAPVSRPDDSMPLKYILRSELLYARDGAPAGPAEGGWDPEAVRLLREAQQKEQDCDFPGAIRTYNRLRYAFPELAEAAQL